MADEEPGATNEQLGKQPSHNLLIPSDDLLDAHDPEANIPILMSPIRTEAASDSLRTLTTLSTLDTSVSLSTPGAEISVGPQAIPFALRRTLTLPQAESPFRAPQRDPVSNTLPLTQELLFPPLGYGPFGSGGDRFGFFDSFVRVPDLNPNSALGKRPSVYPHLTALCPFRTRGIPGARASSTMSLTTVESTQRFPMTPSTSVTSSA
jgi:hypothetical protein